MHPVFQRGYFYFNVYLWEGFNNDVRLYNLQNYNAIYLVLNYAYTGTSCTLSFYSENKKKIKTQMDRSKNIQH